MSTYLPAAPTSSRSTGMVVRAARPARRRDARRPRGPDRRLGDRRGARAAGRCRAPTAPQYTNVQMPFPGPPPHVPDDNPTGVYRRTVDGARGVGAGSGSCCTSAARSRCSTCTSTARPSAWARTPRLAAGVRPHRRRRRPVTPFELALTVVRWSDATYLEDQDHWYHAGLHRSVFALRDAAGPHRRRARRRRLRPGDRRRPPACACRRPPERPQRRRARRPRALGRRSRRRGTARCEHPTDWSSTACRFDGPRRDVVGRRSRASRRGPPRRRRCTTSPSRSSTPTATCSTRWRCDVGFRRVEVRGHELLVNGRAVLIKGVNRHDHDPRRGKAVTARVDRRPTSS